MTSQADFVRPPRIAIWLVKLFASVEEESILGDLLEEYSNLDSFSRSIGPKTRSRIAVRIEADANADSLAVPMSVIA